MSRPPPGCLLIGDWSVTRLFLRQLLFIEKEGLPASVLAELKQLATFHNPDFYKRQSQRLSTARTPRVISCAEDPLSALTSRPREGATR